jgi:hypothetical protein
MNKQLIRGLVEMGITEGQYAIKDREAQRLANRVEAERRNRERCQAVAERHIIENLANIIRDGMLEGKNPVEVFHSDCEGEAYAVAEALSDFTVKVEGEDNRGYPEDEITMTYRVFLTLPRG